MHSAKITVWCGLWAGGVIGPNIFRDDQDRHVTVNGNRYRSIIIEYFYDLGLDNVWFQQDSATSHTANVTINLLETKFGERLESVGRLERGATLSLWSMVCQQASVWTSASVPMVVMVAEEIKKSSLIHNGLERTFTGIKII